MKHLIIMLSIFCLLTLFALNVNMVSAWPYQLNLSNGVLYDTNASNNATTNFTIYVVNQTYILNNTINQTINQTIYINQTNLTCFNCTYLNATNHTYIYNMNGTNGSFYNSSEADIRFLTNTEFTSYKNSLITTVPRAEFDSLVTRVNAINITNTSTNNSHGGLWGGIIIGWLLTAIAVYFIVKGGSSESLN